MPYRKLLIRNTWWIVAIWTLVLIALLALDLNIQKTVTQNLVIKEARTHLQKDEAFRFWAATHGGFYVPVTRRTPPNPYLEHVPERDIQSPSGKRLTLMNPAYALRQMNEDFAETYGVSGHITSLLPLRPENAPDDWERSALESFEKGEKEIIEFSEIEGRPFLRLMQPLITQKGCLKCHGHQGYNVGDVRGGVSVSVSLDDYLYEEQYVATIHVLSFILVWILGFVLIILGSFKLRKIRVKRELTQRMLNESYDQLEIQVQKRTAQLSEINKELKDFSYIVSHDLKAPLRAISQLSHWISTDYEDAFDKEGKEMLTLLGNRVKRMDLLIDGILQYSKVGRVENEEPIDLNSLVEDIIVSLAASENIEIKVVDTLPKYIGDPTRFTQVFQNLISNSIKFIDKPKGIIKIACIDEDKYWKFSVVDNGPGIEEKYFDKAFQIFQTLQPRDKQEGTGVGLSLVKKIINYYKGDVWIESKMGEGTTVFFTLPKIDVKEKKR